MKIPNNLAIDSQQNIRPEIKPMICNAAFVAQCCFVMGASSALLLSNLPDVRLLVQVIAILVLIGIRLRQARYLAVGVFGLLWISLYGHQASLPDQIEGKWLQLEGRVLGLPDESNRVRFLFRPDSQVWLDDVEIIVPEFAASVLQLSCYQCPLNINTGERWRFWVKLKKRRGFASHGAFDYEKYLYRKGIIATGYIRNKEAQRLAQESLGFDVHALRQQISRQITNQLEGKDNGASLAKALLIGDRASMSANLEDNLKRYGLMHLTAISGLHIGLVFVAALWVFRIICVPFVSFYDVLPRQKMVLLPALSVAFFYAALAGFSISTLRALLMLSLFVFCRFIGKDIPLIKLLVMTMVLVILVDPLSILDAGFWLSVVAVAGIAVASYQKPSGVIRTQCMIWLAMLPVLSLFFQQVPVLSPIINLFAVPLFCFIFVPVLLISLLAGLMGWAAISDFLLNTMAIGLEWFAQSLEVLPFEAHSLWRLPSFSLLETVIYVAMMLAFLLARPYAIGLTLALLMKLALPAGDSIPYGSYQVVLLDAGQGLSMLVTTRSQTLLYDTGPRYPSGFSVAEAVVVPYLRHHSIKEIDTLVVSHADTDHIGGVDYLRKQLEIGQIITSAPAEISGSQLCQTGDQWQIDGVRFAFISPDADTPKGKNNRSCVLRIDNTEITTLISGDIERQTERDLLRRQQHNLSADILLVPHQGSKTSSTQAFLDAVAPSVGLVAAGYRNQYRHPHAKVMERYYQKGIPVFSTIGSGTVTIQVSTRRYEINEYRVDHRRFWHQ